MLLVGSQSVKVVRHGGGCCDCSQVNWSKDDWILCAKLTGRSFSGPDTLSAVAGHVTDYPLKFLPLSEGTVEVMTTVD